MKNHLIVLLNQTYPGVTSYFDSPARPDMHQKWGDFVSTYWHVGRVRKMSLSTFTDHYQKWWSRERYNFGKTKTKEIYRAAKELFLVLLNFTKHIIKQAVGQLHTTSQTIEELRSLMNKTASCLPEYLIVIATKGFGPSPNPQLMVENSNVTRFSHRNTITSFAGIALRVNESGNYDKKSVLASKHDSPILRNTLLQSMGILTKRKPQDNPAYLFMSNLLCLYDCRSEWDFFGFITDE